MGRLQRKKSPSEKKRTVQKDGAADTGNETGTTPTKVESMPAGKKSGPPARAAAKVREPNIFDKSIQFLREVKVELKKVAWPGRKQTIGSTVVVIVLVSIISAFLGVVDIVLGKLIQVVLN